MESQPQLPQETIQPQTALANDPLQGALSQQHVDPKSLITKNDKRFKTKVRNHII